jgi:hypothetical protein
MNRDMDLVRAILSKVAEKLPPIGYLQDRVSIEGYDAATIDGHIALLIEAGFLEGKVNKAANVVAITGLPWKGHDFIDAARDDTTWAKAKATILKHGASLSFDVLLEVLKAEGKKRLGLGS